MELIDLGHCVGRLNTAKNWECLEVISPVDSSDNAVIPAASVRIYSVPNLLRLRDALNKAFPVQEIK